jgi:hypothetical protein
VRAHERLELLAAAAAEKIVQRHGDRFYCVQSTGVSRLSRDSVSATRC